MPLAGWAIPIQRRGPRRRVGAGAGVSTSPYAFATGQAPGVSLGAGPANPGAWTAGGPGAPRPASPGAFTAGGASLTGPRPASPGALTAGGSTGGPRPAAPGAFTTSGNVDVRLGGNVSTMSLNPWGADPYRGPVARSPAATAARPTTPAATRPARPTPAPYRPIPLPAAPRPQAPAAASRTSQATGGWDVPAAFTAEQQAWRTAARSAMAPLQQAARQLAAAGDRAGADRLLQQAQGEFDRRFQDQFGLQTSPAQHTMGAGPQGLQTSPGQYTPNAGPQGMQTAPGQYTSNAPAAPATPASSSWTQTQMQTLDDQIRAAAAGLANQPRPEFQEYQGPGMNTSVGPYAGTWDQTGYNNYVNKMGAYLNPAYMQAGAYMPPGYQGGYLPMGQGQDVTGGPRSALPEAMRSLGAGQDPGGGPLAGWSRPGEQAPAEEWQYDLQGGWVPPGQAAPAHRTQVSMGPGFNPRRRDPGFHVAISPPGVAAPVDAPNWTPTLQQWDPPGRAAPSQHLNLSLLRGQPAGAGAAAGGGALW